MYPIVGDVWFYDAGLRYFVLAALVCIPFVGDVGEYYLCCGVGLGLCVGGVGFGLCFGGVGLCSLFGGVGSVFVWWRWVGLCLLVALHFLALYCLICGVGLDSVFRWRWIGFCCLVALGWILLFGSVGLTLDCVWGVVGLYCWWYRVVLLIVSHCICVGD